MSEKNPLWYELPAVRWQERNADGHRTWTDSQKQKLYNAENRFRRAWRNKYKEFRSLDEAQRYADKFLKSAWCVRRWGEQDDVTITAKAGNTCVASKLFRTISLCSWGMDEVVLLHELSHIVHPNGAGMGHGRYFCRTFLETIGHKLGPKAKKALRAEYIRKHVKCTPKPEYSLEARAGMRARGLAMADKLGWGK